MNVVLIQYNTSQYDTYWAMRTSVKCVERLEKCL